MTKRIQKHGNKNKTEEQSKHRPPMRRAFRVADWTPFTRGLRKALSQADCKHDYAQAKKVLRSMGVKNDVLPYCEDNGGYCDCEILLNVSRPTRFDFPEEA